MVNQSEFPHVFEKIKTILKPYSKKIIVKIDTSEDFSLGGAHTARNGRKTYSSPQHR